LFKLSCLSESIIYKTLAKANNLLLKHKSPGASKVNIVMFRYSMLVAMLMSLALNTIAEGTKQLDPLTPNAANGSLGLVLYSGGWTANGERIPFATVGCPAVYRLNVYISDTSTEKIYFGFKQDGTQPLFYQFRDPSGAVVPGFALTSEPTIGNNGYIPNWNQAVAGPKFGIMNPTGYTPLVITPTMAGNYYLEFAEDAAGTTTNMNGTTIDLFDVSVYSGNTVKNGRLWSQAWQFYDNQFNNSHAPQTDFFIYSDDSIVTKLNINRWQGMHFMFYCNHWGVINTGNWYTDRLSRIATSQATWPGETPQYKIFLNDPDSLIYPTGSFGKICSVQTNSKCDGSVDFLVKVNKPGKIELTIDVDPQGINNGEDININADVNGSPDCSVWDTIPWNGYDGLGQLLTNGATVNVNVNYLNGLTHLPIYDIETNTHGIMVDLVRPVPVGSSKLNIFWDDHLVPGCGPVCTNLTGCIYPSAATACHTWPNNNQGNLVIYNSWWYYESGSAAVSPVIKRLPATATTAPAGPSPVCSGQSNLLYTIPPIQFAESYLWTLPNGSTVNTASNSISLSFPTPASGGILMVQGVNANCGTGNFSPQLLITVNPTPVATATPASQIICSGSTTNIVLTSNVPGTTFTWTATAPASVSGFNNGSGSLIAQTLTNGSNSSHDVTYIVTPSAGGCIGAPITVIVTVQPANNITSLPLAQTICSGQTFVMNLTATLPGTNFSWTVSGVGITGYSNGSGNVISQTLFNTTAAPASAVYVVTGTINGCTTSTTLYTVTVNNLPTQYSLSGGGEYCFGGTGTLVGLTGSQSGVTYQLFNNGTAVGTPLPGNGSAINFGNQTLAGNYTVTGTRIGDGCSTDMGNSVNIAINPLPVANAGSDFTIPFGISTTINGSASGGSGVYTYSWSPLANIAMGANTATPLTTNLYSNTAFNFQVTDAKGCISNDQVIISLSGSALNVIASANPIQICADGSQSQLFATASGGSGVYSYSWSSIPAGSPVWASALQNPMVSPGVTTTYMVQVNDGYNTASASAMVVVNPLPLQYNVTGGGIYCVSGMGIPVGLSGSQANTSYQLMQGGLPVGPAVFGTGNQISFGNQTNAGVYTVVATNLTTGCVNTMNGSTSVTVNPLPTIYKIDPVGQQCPGTIIRLNGSELGVNYYLLLNGVVVDSLPGTGIIGFLDYGARYANGTYTVLAVDMATGCQALMNGSTYISIAPQVFDVIPAGILCPGQMIMLSGSEVGVSYQLRWNTTFDLGSPVPGTGSALNMGTGTLPGVYTVIAIGDTTNCVSYMNDSATLYPNPVVFSIVPDGVTCEGDEIKLNGSEIGVDYILLLDNAIHVDTIHGTGSAINFGAQYTAGNYTIIAVIQNSFCITQMDGVAIFNASPVKYDIVPAGIICIGNSIGLAGSETGVSYQLIFNGSTNMGSPVAGTGSPISFGPQFLVGTYTVRAVNASTGCNSVMNGSADLVPLPTVYSVTPSGNHCAPTNIGTNGSELNFNYILVLDGSINIDTIAGTGAALDFGPQITAGTYTVVAFSSSTFCMTNMSGSSVIDARPNLYAMTPAGSACSGDVLGLQNSDLGVTYQLRFNGTINVGSPVAGTGSSISFGVQTIAGLYSVEAVGSNGCPAIMSDSVTLDPIPVVYTILPSGSHCPGTVITLNGSGIGVNYVLFRDGTIPIDTVAGTGGVINFGTPMIAGTYSVMAYSAVALCQTAMNGTSVIMLSPTAFNVVPAGINCIGSNVGLDNSEIGVNYQLRRDGITNVGAPVAGTGSAISFGVINIPGTYTVIATGTLNACGSTMNGSAIIQPNPLVFTIIPQGMQCAGISIKLNGSQVGTDYVLVLDNTFNIDTIAGTGAIIDFGPQSVTGTYTIIAIGGATSCQAIMNGSTQIMASPAFFNITPAGFTCSPATLGLDGSETGVNYTLYKNGVTTGITVAGTGNAISFGVQTEGDYTVEAADQTSGCSIFIPGTLQISAPPLVNAGADVTICETQTVSLNATVTSGGATVWSTSGDGTFDNISILNPVYTPGMTDIAAGTVNLLLTVDGTGSCIGAQFTDTVAVTIDHLATANAGGNIDVCTASNYTINATATNYNTISWSTSGTGLFSNNNALNPTYTPSAADLAAGSVTLTMVVNGNSPCSNVASDVITMTFHPMVTVNAGIDAQICEGDTYTIATASATNNQSVSWSTTGTGTFAAGNTFTATYSPSSSDIASGSVKLVLTAIPSAPCLVSVSDTMILTLIQAPVSIAGADVLLCENTSLIISDASVINASSQVWSTSGSGSFSNNTIINPVYTPTAADLAAGSVVLTLTVNGNPFCNTVATDQKIVTFVKNAIVNAGADASICTTPYTLSGITATNCASVLWTVQTGSGIIANANTLTPTFTPSAQDITNGFVVLALTGTPLSPCSNVATDFVTLTINQVPVVNAGADINTCNNSAFTVNDATASLYTSLDWTTSGTGTFLNGSTLTPTYTPGASDIANGSVVLTLTASNAGCGVVTDNKIISFINLTTVNAGPDATICEGSNLNIGGASASSYSSIFWTTTGTGSFSNGNTLTPTYIPSLTDIAIGAVTLSLNAVSIAPCNNVISDPMILLIHKNPVVWAGNDAVICENSIYTNNDGFILNSSVITWSTSGSGTFSNVNTLYNTYTPSVADIAAGSVMLTLTSTGNAPCNDLADQKQISFATGPVADAGPGSTICNSCNFVISASSTQNSNAVLWSSSGSGSFDNAASLHPIYTPSTTDYAQGSVILSLTAFSNPPCTSVVDTMTLTFSNNPGVEFTWGTSCESMPVNFSVNTVITNVAQVATWIWNFGDGSTSNLMNPTHLFAGIGEYTVTLTAIDINGSAKAISHVVTVSQPPAAFFTYSNPNCSNEDVNLIDLSHTLYGYIAEWVWNYGDGSPNDTVLFPDEPNQAHRFTGAGTFNVTLSITNSFGCKSMITIPVDVIEAPIANFQYTHDCSGTVTSFLDASFANGPGNTVQYWWDFGDPTTGIDNTSDLKDPVHLFSAPGIYLVKHIVRNFNNCTDTIVKPVTILEPVAVDFIQENNSCINAATNFAPDVTVMNIAVITSWLWDFGDGVTNTQPSTSHAYAGPGTYQVTLTVTDTSGCTASKTHTVVVNPLPVAMFNVQAIPCSGTPVHFDDVSTTYAGYIIEWNWDFGDGNTQQVVFPGNADIDHIYAAPGIYTVKLTIKSSDSCMAERIETVIVNPTPVANFDYENACQGTPVLFTDLTQTGGTGVINGWAWDFGDGASGGNNTSTLQNPSHTYTSTGTYQVTLSVSTANGCSSTIVKTVTITVAPFVDFGYDYHCVNSSIQFTPATGVNIPDVATWYWSFGDGITSALANPQHTYNTAGNYVVTLTITNTNGCQNTISHAIAIIPAPVANFSTNTPACSQHQVNFYNQSSASVGYIVRWEYDFGDGTTLTVNYPANPSVSHTYSTYGLYNVSLTVVTNDSCSATTQRTIQILQSPLANFDYDNSCSGMPLQFTDLSQGNLISWEWNFGDSGSGANNTSNLQNPVHTYMTAGTYVVNLLVQNLNGCTDTVNRTVVVAPKPVVDFSFNNGCAADTVHFISSTFVNVATTTTWLWEFGDNSISTDVDPNHIYITPGTYSVSLTITNQNGCTNVKTRQVQVTTAPIAMFNSNAPSCSGTAVLFTDISSTPNGIISSWTWDFGDGTITTVNAPANPNISHAYTTSGIYDVVLTIQTSTGCEAFYTSSVTINDAPVTAFSSVGNCSGTLTSFTDLSQSAGSGITSWSWDFGDPASGMNNISNLPDPQHMFSGEGTFDVTLTTENNAGCSSSLTQTVTIAPAPAVDFLSSSACLSTPVVFNADPAVTNIADVASYLWDFGDGSATSTLAAPEHLYTQSGSYVVTLTITNLTGCENSISHTITVHALPVAQFTNSGNCTGNLVQFTDISYNPDGEDIVAWAWDFGVSTTTNDTSSLQNPTYIYTAGGTYNVTLTITSLSGCTSVKVISIQVVAAPTAQYSYVAEPCHNGSVLFMDESTSSQSLITGWYWEFAPGIYSTLQNPVHVYGVTDTCVNVKLVVTTANGCTDTIIKSVCIPAGLEVDVNYTQTCFGETTWFTPTLVQPTGGTIAFYNWNFGDQSTGIYNESKLANPEHKFSKPGTFVVSLQAFDVNNCSTTTYKTVIVSPLPKADFSIIGGACDSLVSFKDITTAAPIAHWTWDFGDGNSQVIDAPAIADVEHYYPVPGVYNVTLITESEAGCSDTVTKAIRRTPCISAQLAISDTTVCQKRTMHFTESSVCQAPIASWQWFFGDNTSETYTTQKAVIEHTYAVAGIYTVKLVIATQMVGGMVTDTASTQVAVKPAAKAGYSWEDVCIGNTTQFENLTKNNNTTIKSYQWNFGDPGSPVDTSTVKHPEYTYDVYGEYDVRLVVTNTLGCTDTIVNKVKIFENPVADFKWNSSCDSRPVLFTDNSDTTSSAIVSWNWLFKNGEEVMGASTQPNTTYSFSGAGIYDAELKITDRNGCSTSTSKQVAINSSPVAAFNIVENYENKPGQVLMNNGTLNGSTYEWNLGNGTTAYSENPVVTFDKEGTYNITLISSNGQNCSDTLTMAYEFMYKGLFVPNAFNPGNMDPEVAVFKPKGTNLKSYYIEVVDRWGNVLWSSSKLDSKGSPAEEWDGKIHGEVLQQGVYVWKIVAQFRDGQVWDGINAGNNENMPQSNVGTVTLIR
jgi:PKD repeat protein